MIERIRRDLIELMLLPGLSGHEDRVRRAIKQRLSESGIESSTDTLGNLHAHFTGTGPRVMLFAHMDQLGFIVRRIEPNGLLRLSRLGGVPERTLAAQDVLVCVAEGRDVPGVIANKSHHATTPEEKYHVARCDEIYVDTGHSSATEVESAGIHIGQAVVYQPQAASLANDRIVGTSVDDRAACAVLIDVARQLQLRSGGPPVDIAFTVQEEFNLRGAQPLAQTLKPDIAIQLDLMLATDTPDMQDLGDMRLGAGPGMSLYSFHGRGTLNGVIPHPAMVHLVETSARELEMPLQRSAQVGVLTDLSYVQHVGSGVACIDLGFPIRASHSAREVCDLNDLVSLATLIKATLANINESFSLNRDDYT
jgi:putative aminopeptidase FrvX